jgi:hypothetical protein
VEGKQKFELLNIQNTLLGETERERERDLPSPGTGSNIRQEEPEMKFRVRCKEASCEMLVNIYRK